MADGNKTPQGQSTAPKPTSPSKVSGSRVLTGGDFRILSCNTGVIVDKTLICKAFWMVRSSPVCICLPRRFGKSFNISIIEEFFNVPNSTDNAPVAGQLDENACRNARRQLFENKLLLTEEPDFFDDHFCKYPVIRVDLKGNADLEAGMLVGVHKFALGQMSSGVNNIWYMPLVADTTSESEDVDHFDLSWYFGYSEDEIKLLIKKARSAKEGRLGIGNPTDADILETMRR
ncbi:hypothetical protein EV175_006628, partial [Coemansia sp. RSA 1933]